MKTIKPKASVTYEKRFYFTTFIIENIAVPIRMIALPHVCIFIGVGSIEHK
jgi:hypothetical protein